MAQHLNLNSPSLLVGRSMDLVTRNLAVVCTSATERTRQVEVAESSTLHSQCLAHDGATTAKDLQIGHFAAADGRITRGDRGRKSAQGRRAGFFQKRADALGLDEESLHWCGLLLVIDVEQNGEMVVTEGKNEREETRTIMETEAVRGLGRLSIVLKYHRKTQMMRKGRLLGLGRRYR